MTLTNGDPMTHAGWLALVLFVLIGCSEQPAAPQRSAIPSPPRDPGRSDAGLALEPPAAPAVTGPLLAFQRFSSGTDPDHIYIAGLDGASPRKLGAGIHPAISPDGELIAYVSGFVVEIVEIATGAEVAEIPNAVVFPVAWSRDGSRLLIETGGGLGSVGRNGGKVSPIARPVGCEAFTWAAGNDRLYCFLLDPGPKIIEHGLDGTVIETIALSRKLGLGDSIQCWMAAARTKKQLVLGCDFDDEGEDGRLILVDLTTKRGRRLTTPQQYAVDAAWLPDDAGLVIGLNVDGSEQMDIVRLDVETGETTVLVERAFGPAVGW